MNIVEVLDIFKEVSKAPLLIEGGGSLPIRIISHSGWILSILPPFFNKKGTLIVDIENGHEYVNLIRSKRHSPHNQQLYAANVYGLLVHPIFIQDKIQLLTLVEFLDKLDGGYFNEKTNEEKIESS